MTSEQFERRKQKAIALMDSRKMWRSNYAPPLLRGLWKLGLKIPPTPFMSFRHVLVLMSVWYSVVWGLVMYFVLGVRRECHLLSPVFTVSVPVCSSGFLWRCFTCGEKRSTAFLTGASWTEASPLPVSVFCSVTEITPVVR